MSRDDDLFDEFGDFDENNLFDDDADSEFDFGGDDLGDAELSDETFDLDDDEFVIDDEPERNSNRVFVILALLLLLTFIVGLGVVLFLALRDPGPSDIELTATQIVIENAQTEAAATENAIVRSTEAAGTQIALLNEQTATAEAEQTAVPLTLTAEAAITQEAATAAALTEIALSATPTPLDGLALDLIGTQTAQAEFLTQTAEAEAAIVDEPVEPEVTPTQPGPAEPLTADDIALTATAIAQALRGEPGTPTPDDGVEAPPIITDPSPPSELPDTGLFDDLTSDQGLLMALLVAFGLIGVIAVSRTIRATTET